MRCFERRHCEKLCCERTSQFYICVYIQCRRRRPTDRILTFLFPAETDVLVPVFSQSTDVVVVNFVVVLKFPIFCAATATGSYSHFRFTFPATLASRRDSAPTPHRLFCRCVENVRFFFSSLPERQVFFIINTLFQDCPSLFLPGWPPNNPNKRKFFILFRFCTKSCCTNDRQILQLFFIMKGAELFYE